VPSRCIGAWRGGAFRHGCRRRWRAAPLLYVSPGQINFLVPDGTAPGLATFGGVGSDVHRRRSTGCAHALSMNGAGSGVAAATAITVQAANPLLQTSVPVFQCAGASCASVPIVLGGDTLVYVSFFGTGIRNRSSMANVAMTINGIGVPVLYAGPAPGFTGLDQVNVALVLSLRGKRESNVVLTVGWAGRQHGHYRCSVTAQPLQLVHDSLPHPHRAARELV